MPVNKENGMFPSVKKENGQCCFLVFYAYKTGFNNDVVVYYLTLTFSEITPALRRPRKS